MFVCLYAIFYEYNYWNLAVRNTRIKFATIIKVAKNITILGRKKHLNVASNIRDEDELK